MEEATNPLQFDLTKALLITNTGNAYDLLNSLVEFTYYEDLECFFPTARVSFFDLKAADLAVQGGEKLTIVVANPMHATESVEHEFVLKNIKSVAAEEGGKLYSADCIKAESEVVSKHKTKKVYDGTGDSIIRTMMEDAGFSGTISAKGPAPFNKMRVAGSGRNVTHVAHQICVSSIPDGDKDSNTCGYFLYGTKDGYYFASIDHLLSLGEGDDKYQGQKAIYSYYNAPARTGGIPEQLVMQDFYTDSDGDLKVMADAGVFAATIREHNVDTKENVEIKWRLKDHWDKWGHIANNRDHSSWQSQQWQEFLDQEEGSKTFSIRVSQEATHDGEEPASMDNEEGSEDPADVQDWGRYTVCQYNARRATMAMNVSNLVVPGNHNLCAGQKVDLLIKSSKPDAEKSDDDKDLMRSGNYLIFRIAHRYNRVANESYSAMTLVRDTSNKNC
tara:strand:- start:72067 stop:73401 length:1335 start_codon:yes stop_codon:yes gene_type:complete